MRKEFSSEEYSSMKTHMAFLRITTSSSTRMDALTARPEISSDANGQVFPTGWHRWDSPAALSSLLLLRLGCPLPLATEVNPGVTHLHKTVRCQACFPQGLSPWLADSCPLAVSSRGLSCVCPSLGSPRFLLRIRRIRAQLHFNLVTFLKAPL